MKARLLAGEFLVKVYDAHIEERGVDNTCCMTDSRAVICQVVRRHVEIYSIKCLFRVQLTGLAVKSGTVIVEDTVGDIAGLLHLGKCYATSNSMHAACGDIEHIAGMYFMTGKT